jgi:hypothetical protein
MVDQDRRRDGARPMCGFHPGAATQLGQSVADVHLDGPWAQEELPGDLAIAAPLVDEAEYLELVAGEDGAVQQSGDLTTEPRFRPFAERAQPFEGALGERWCADPLNCDRSRRTARSPSPAGPPPPSPPQPGPGCRRAERSGPVESAARARGRTSRSPVSCTVHQRFRTSLPRRHGNQNVGAGAGFRAVAANGEKGHAR